MEIRHYRFRRITLDPNKCFGKPCIRGLRMPVASILSYLRSGMTIGRVAQCRAVTRDLVWAISEGHA